MPYGMPHVMARGPVLRRLADWLNERVEDYREDKASKAPLEYIYNSLDLTSTVLADLMEHHMDFTAGQNVIGNSGLHVRDHWFAGEWWPELHPIEPVAQAGLKYALWLNLQYGEENQKHLWRDYAIHWVCQRDYGRGKKKWWFFKDWKEQSQDFQISINESCRQITLLVMTPDEPPDIKPPLTVTEHMYLARKTDPANSGYGEAPVPPPTSWPAGTGVEVISILGADDNYAHPLRRRQPPCGPE